VYATTSPLNVAPDAAGHLRTMLIVTAAFSLVVVIGKGGFDLFVPGVIAWTALSVAITARTRGAGSFVIGNLVLLVGDSLLDIVVMGQHLPIALAAPWTIVWGASPDPQAGVIAYWVLLWGVAMPHRTLAMLDSVPQVRPGTKIWLLIAVIGLHVCFVEDVVYFAILGYPPLVSIPPHNYEYLPHIFGMPEWSAQSVWAAAAVGTIGFAAAAAYAIAEQRKVLPVQWAPRA
jgi:hypothetical protein